jgi:hypothetical protein
VPVLVISVRRVLLLRRRPMTSWRFVRWNRRLTLMPDVTLIGVMSTVLFGQPDDRRKNVSTYSCRTSFKF